MYKRLRTATILYEQATNDMKNSKSLDIQPLTGGNGDYVMNYSYRLYSVGGGLFWILSYVLLWTQVGNSLTHILATLIGLNLSIYIISAVIAFFRAQIAVAKADNARTDRRYVLTYDIKNDN